MGPRYAVAALLAGMLASTAAHAWTVRVGGLRSSATAVASDARGDVFTAIEIRPSGTRVSVRKLSGANGRTLWKRTFRVTGLDFGGRINALQVATNGDVI